MSQAMNGNEEPNRRFVSEKKLADLWNCHRSTVSRILKRSGIQPYYFGPDRNGLKRYSVSDIETFINESKAPTP